jgi:T5SS/PEP-CTERM-associated repeat protein
MNRKMTRTQQSLTIAAAAALSLWSAGTVRAAVTSNWNNTSGGDFNTAANWNSPDSSTHLVPGADDTATFGLDNTYTVTLGSDVTNTALNVSSGSVTLDLGGHTYTQTASTTVAGGGTPWLTLQNGTLKTTGGAGYIGAATASNKVTVTTGGIWDMGTASLQVGRGNGSLEILNGGQVYNKLGYLAYGNGVTYNDSVTVDGEGSLWKSTSTLFAGIYNNSHGTLTISGGGKVQNAGASLGKASTSNPSSMDVTVTGTGSTGIASTWQTNNITMNNDTTLNVNNGGKVIPNPSAALTANANSTVNLGGTGTVALSGNIAFTDAALNITGLSNTLSTSGGAITFDPASTFTITLDADQANQSASILTLGGNWTMGDNGIDVSLDTGYSPVLGDTFNLLSYTGTLTGTLDTNTVHLQPLTGNLKWDTSDLAAGTVRVESALVPEPASLALAACAGLILLRRRRIA